MKLFVYLLRHSWRIVLVAGVIGGLSGISSVALIAIIHRTLRDPGGSTTVLLSQFAGLCVVVLFTRVFSQLLLKRLVQATISQVRMGLCQRILESPLRRLEEIGEHRMLASLTGDVHTISFAMNGLPVVCINIVILICGAVYLGLLSTTLLLGSIVVCVLGISSYLYSAAFARTYLRRARESQDVLIGHIRRMIDGLKGLKMHHARREEFFGEVLQAANDEVCRDQFIGRSLQGAAVIWGRLFFFLAIGLLLFAWPKMRHIDSATLTGYIITILYLMSPLERIIGYLPLMAMAKVSIDKIQRLGLMLDEEAAEPASVVPIHHWESIQLCDVTHSYRRQNEDHRFSLGPIDLEFRPGEIVFIVGGNGSGKTTLIKLVAGLYVPEQGEVRLDGQAVTLDNRESYRQLYSAVFDDAVLFDKLMGTEATGLDGRAREYLRELELDHVVSIDDGVFSTTKLSRGQRKRLALLTAYLEDRPIYMFDEWAADQDPVFKRLFYRKLLPDMQNRGKTILAITHDDRYFDVADRVIKLEDGCIVQPLRKDAARGAVDTGTMKICESFPIGHGREFAMYTLLVVGEQK